MASVGPSRAAVFDTLSHRYGSHPKVRERRIDGDIQLLEWFFTRDGVDYAAVASAGLAQVDFTGHRPTEVVCEVLASQVGAAAAAVELAILRCVRELHAPWTPGRPWVFPKRPLLEGTLIRGLMVAPSGGGPDHDVLRDEAGNPVGDLQTILLLTDEEVRAVSELTDLTALVGVQQRSGQVLANVRRPQAHLRRRLPYPRLPEAAAGSGELRHFSSLATTRVTVTPHLQQQAVRHLVCLPDGSFTASPQPSPSDESTTEKPPPVWTLEQVVERNPWLRQFALTALSGDSATYHDASGQWVISRG